MWLRKGLSGNFSLKREKRWNLVFVEVVCYYYNELVLDVKGENDRRANESRTSTQI